MVFWAERTVSEYSTAEQRALVPLSTVWGMHACTVLIFTAFIGLSYPLTRLLGRRRLLIGLGLASLGYLACGLAPKTNRIFYDEHIYMQIGQTIAHTGKASYANFATAEYGDFIALDTWVNKQPNGHPYLLSWAYRIFGASEDISHILTRILVGCTAALLYFALMVAPWTLPAGAPLGVALCFIFTPLVLWWGHTVAVEPSAVATTTLCFFAVCVHARCRDLVTGEGSPLSAAFLGASAAFAAYFRPESLLVYPVAASLLWASDRRFLEDRTTWAAFGLSVALLLPNLLHLWSVRTEDWGATDGRRFDFAFLALNFSSNAGYFIRGKWFPVAGSVLALIGMWWLAHRNRWLALSVGMWFSLSWGIFILFYAGGYHYGSSYRYAVISSGPVALLMGIGASVLVDILREKPVFLGGVSIVVGMNWLSAMAFVPTLGRESNQARADVNFVHETAPKLPTGALVISPDPCLWNLQGKNAAQIDNVEHLVRNEMNDLLRQYPGGIYLHWDYWANMEPRFSNVWKKLVIDTRATVFARKTAEAVKLALFRLDTPYARQTMGGHGEIGGPLVDLDSVTTEALIGDAQALTGESKDPVENLPLPIKKTP